MPYTDLIELIPMGLLGIWKQFPLFLFEMFTTSVFWGFFHNLLNRKHIFISAFSFFLLASFGSSKELFGAN